jgi:hypothetical protein
VGASAGLRRRWGLLGGPVGFVVTEAQGTAALASLAEIYAAVSQLGAMLAMLGTLVLILAAAQVTYLLWRR